MDVSMLLAGGAGLLAGVGVVAGPVVVLLRRASGRARELAELVASYRYDATHDGLTGLLNRTGFYDRAGRLVADPGGRDLAVALFDVDGFKAVNDRLGHGAGDIALVAIAAHLREIFGEKAVLARLGGDEFAAVLPHDTLLTMRLFSASSVFVDAPIGELLRISTGMTLVCGPSDLAVLLARADDTMYRAKNGPAAYDPATGDHAAPLITGPRPKVRTRDLVGSGLVAGGGR
jgi:diguanylate cyclase (GGDEF)-like protein